MEQEKLLERCVEIANKVDELVGHFALGYNNLTFESSVKYDYNGIAIDIFDVVDFKEELDFIIESLVAYVKDNIQDHNWNEVVNLTKLAERIDDFINEIDRIIVLIAK